MLFLAMGFVILGALSFLFVPAGLLFLPAIMLISLSDGVRLPARNAVIQTNFSRRERSSVLGKLMLFSAAAVITGILIGGRILNSNYLLYKGVFPLALMCLFLSNFILANIRSKVKGNATHRKFKLSRPFEPYVHLLQLLREDRFFLMFEVGFFLYGCGFMTMMAMNPIYYYDKFGALPSQFRRQTRR
ncbi:MAG: MFS transporter [Planctomycetota bacterium]|nr:MFS transporter [Planctomycetota bacterium]